METLNAKQEAFSQAVASGETYAEAYRIAYEPGIKTKVESIWVMSSRVMSDVKVQLRIKEIQEENKKRNQVTLDEVIKELSEWLRFNIKTIFNTDGTMKQIHEMTDQESACIASYENVELFGNSGDGKAQIGYIRKVKLIDKQATADKFMKFFGAYIDNHKVTIEDMSHLKDLLNGIKE